ncbi:S-methyl-5-thioribose-1-phosphate isomerase [Methanobrevibacter boviskoreani]|uniref:S-methyl-5-thioribose-1-phosphate isomerase n=1 Tax=Methanobrevibacter boviskoreani TaxID=1348249 RepID=UPI0023F48543|nr:S-methyl-5-thioribose-1-phosphate isomerase [Methanobrevibacter boviskoreani]MDD6256052.1 S-methyl-5-thioribose-1-phosphate isomerase [Methanobrevibacter boviskoreani]
MKTLEWENNKLKLIDQRKLPDELEYVYCSNYQEVIAAIKNMTVRGAPAIGVSAAFGMALADIGGVDLNKAADEIKAARPTAKNLFWAVDRVLDSENPLHESLKIYDEDMKINRAIGKYGREIIDDGDTILTHCNAGALACVDYGTALGVIRAANDEGKNINVICDETRPRGQGARLSVWEMQQENIPVKLICDVASGYLMSQGMIDKVVIGADRVAKGGIVNKIGSFMVALAAKRFDIPFYVAAPYSTFDMDININDTVIEERDPDEVIHYGSCRICPKGTEVINPAFDIVPNDLITGIITEKGIIDPL